MVKHVRSFRKLTARTDSGQLALDSTETLVIYQCSLLAYMQNGKMMMSIFYIIPIRLYHV